MRILDGVRLAALAACALACAGIAEGGPGGPASKAGRAEARPAAGCAIAASPAGHGPVTVRFVVRADGTPERFEVLTPGVRAQAAEVIWAGVRACRWEPALDARGRPMASWLAMPATAPQ